MDILDVVWEVVKYVLTAFGALAMIFVRNLKSDINELRERKVDKEVYNDTVANMRQDIRDMRKDILEIPQKVLMILNGNKE